jgi:hypothetical protein
MRVMTSVGLRIDLIELGGLDQRGEDGPVLCAAVVEDGRPKRTPRFLAASRPLLVR